MELITLLGRKELIGLLLAGACSQTLLGGYRFQTLDYLGQPGNPNAINTAGDIVGTLNTSSTVVPYFISYLTDTQGAIGPTFQFTSSSGSAQTASDGLDDAGDVIGVLYSYPQLPNIPLGGVFLRSASGGFTLLPLPAGLSFAAGLAISGNGSIVISGRQSLFFRMKDGSYTSVPVPGAGVASNAATLTGIDNAGNVVGVIFGDINTSSFFRDDSGNVTVQGAGRQNNAGHGSKQLAV